MKSINLIIIILTLAFVALLVMLKPQAQIGAASNKPAPAPQSPATSMSANNSLSPPASGKPPKQECKDLAFGAVMLFGSKAKDAANSVEVMCDSAGSTREEIRDAFINRVNGGLGSTDELIVMTHVARNLKAVEPEPKSELKPELKKCTDSKGRVIFTADPKSHPEPLKCVEITEAEKQVEMKHSIPANAGRDKLGIAMTDIPAGSFLMGSCGSTTEETQKRAFLGQAPRTENCENADANLRAEETPQHRVNIRKFQMSKTEVGLGQFKQFIAAAKRGDLLSDHFMRDNGKGDDAPVMGVSWQDTQDFIAWLNKTYKGDYRLPSEAEWEYACRSDATYCGYKTEEWVQDCWHKNYRGAPSDGSAWKSGCNASNGRHSGVMRGFLGKTYRQQGLSKTRHDPFDTPEPWLSFRLARTH